jgi:predicted ATPase
MIERIRIKNFKSLKDVAIRTRALNVLAGLNGMGKSTMVQALLLLKQNAKPDSESGLKLNGSMVKIGKGQDALYQFAADDQIVLSFTLRDQTVKTWTCNVGLENDSLIMTEGEAPQGGADFLRHFQYLSAERSGPLLLHETSQEYLNHGNLGVKGEYAVHFLHVFGNRRKIDPRLKHPGSEELNLLNQVNAWLAEISPGVKLKIVELPGVDSLVLNYQFELGAGRTASFRPANVGFGISYALAIIVCLLSAEQDSVIVVENPEAHIHPRGQAELGKLMALSAACGAQLFIETHSDHIVNGIRVAVKEGLIGHEDVGFHYFTKTTTHDEQYTDIVQIRVDRRGELSDYPRDFLDEWNNQLLNLVQ